MATYEVEVSRTAERQLRTLSKPDRLRILRAIAGLESTPRPIGCRKLAGLDDVFRIRVGRFRVLYAIEDRRLIVIVLKVGDRKDVYR